MQFGKSQLLSKSNVPLLLSCCLQSVTVLDLGALDAAVADADADAGDADYTDVVVDGVLAVVW